MPHFSAFGVDRESLRACLEDHFPLVLSSIAEPAWHADATSPTLTPRRDAMQIDNASI